MPYRIQEVDGEEHAQALHYFNRLEPEIFPELQLRHIESGYWWIAYLGAEPVAFAGLVLFEPCLAIGYLKRAYVMPDHRGHGLQSRFMALRESKARALGWTQIVSECAASNHASAANFARAGYVHCEPEQPWGASGSVYWVKKIR